MAEGEFGARIREIAAAVAVGAAAFLISLAFWPFGSDAGWLIERYEALSVDPFGSSQYSHRILAPLLAHLLHLDGDRFRILTLLFSPLFLAAIYAYCRRADVPAAGSMAIVLAFALSRAVGNSSLAPGLTDTLTYFLLILSLLAVARPYAFWVLVALNLLNHEQSVFLLPWLLYVRRAAGALRLRPDAVLGALVLGLYAVWRASIDTGVVALHVAYTIRPAADYVAEYGMVWWFLLTSLGFLLVCLFWYAARGRFERNSVLLCLVCSAAPYVMAWDPPRYIHLASGVFLISAVGFLTDRRRLAWFAALLAGNVCLYFASQRVMQLAVASFASGCRGAADPERCIHLSTLYVTLPSLLALPLMWWIARRVPPPAGEKSRVRAEPGTP